MIYNRRITLTHQIRSIYFGFRLGDNQNMIYPIRTTQFYPISGLPLYTPDTKADSI